jgi:hypothetical protein
MLFAQPWRVPAEFFIEQHALGRRPGQLEGSTAMARALFDATDSARSCSINSPP